MGMLEDMMKVLDRVPVWKRLQELPGEVDALKKQVLDLEQKLDGKWPGDVCKFCGARSLRLGSARPISGNQQMEQRWICETCKRTEMRIVKP